MLARTIGNHVWLLVAFFAVVGVLGLAVFPPRGSTNAPTITAPERPAGTIYCQGWPLQDHCLWQIKADERTFRVLPQGVFGQPGRQLHAGHRWFVDVRAVE